MIDNLLNYNHAQIYQVRVHFQQSCSFYNAFLETSAIYICGFVFENSTLEEKVHHRLGVMKQVLNIVFLHHDLIVASILDSNMVFVWKRKINKYFYFPLITDLILLWRSSILQLLTNTNVAGTNERCDGEVNVTQPTPNNNHGTFPNVWC